MYFEAVRLIEKIHGYCIKTKKTVKRKRRIKMANPYLPVWEYTRTENQEYLEIGSMCRFT